MKKIIINGDFLAFETFAGVSRHATEILYELDKIIDNVEVEIVTPNYSHNLLKFDNISIVKYGKKSLNFWKQVDLVKYVKKEKAVFVDLTQAFPILLKGITFVYDCIPELVDTAYQGFVGKVLKRPIKLIQRKIIMNTAHIIATVSNHSKRDLMSLYHIKSDRIRLIGCAWQHIQKVEYSDDILSRLSIERKSFYFSLGSRVPHKNIEWIVAAAEQNKDSIFVVSGENRYCKKFSELTFPKNILFTGYISDGEIRSLMKNCRAFIFPSIYEGFGMPPMEALAEGADIIISNASCLPEIYGKSAKYLDPHNYENIDLEKMQNQEVMSREIVLEKFSWSHSAKLLLDAIKEEM